MKYLRIIIILFGVCLVASCYNRQTRTSLDEAEGLMEAYPDSALHRLMRIDTSMVRYGEDRARYALLMSMALDKNYIDTTTFDILQPAIDYYLKRGNPDERLRTYYYQGRIYQNRGDRDNALKAFMRGIDNSMEYTDALCMARNFVAQGVIYRDFYNLDGYIASYRKASELYRKLRNDTANILVDQEFDCLSNVLNGAIVQGDENQADSLMDLLSVRFPVLSEDQNKSLQGDKLFYILEFKDTDDVRDFINNNGDEWVTDINGLLNLADGYNRIGLEDKAWSILEEISNSSLPYDTLKYKLIRTDVSKNQERYKDAFNSLWEVIILRDSIDQVKLEKRLQYIREINKRDIEVAEVKTRNERLVWIGMCSGLLLTSVIVILILQVRNNRSKKNLAEEKARVAELENERLQSERDLAEEKAKVAELENERLKDVAELERQKAITAQLEAENMAHRIETLEQESESIRKLLDEEKDVSPQLRKAIQERMAMLNAHLAYYITDNESHNKPYDEWIKELTANREEFMDSTRLAFKASYPKFIKYFEDHGLSVQEINYVCLYAIGLNGVEVGRYMNRPGHINISSNIRKKLKIDKHQSNIGVYVRRLRESLKD